MSRFRRATALAAAALLLGTGTVAYADNLEADGDQVGNFRTSTLTFGSIACGETTVKTAPVAIRRNANPSSGNVFANGSMVTIDVTATSGDGLTTPAEVGTIELDEEWTTASTNTISDQVLSSISIAPLTEGAGSGSVTYRASGTNTQGHPYSVTTEMPVTWTSTGSCVTNTAPSAPGVPVASSAVNQGGFTLIWDAATDAEEDALTYILEGKDAGDGDFTVVASELSTAEYTFGDDQPTEGTWFYRVKAVEDGDDGMASEYSDISDAVKVDRTGPNAPTATADRDAEHVDAATSWWKDSVTVTFTDEGDPVLPDFSEGSGVASVTDAQTFGTHGGFTATGTATDYAGNVSDETTFSGSIDASAPVVTAAASGTFVRGSSATIGWTASDTGSGLATDASGTITVDTSTVGTHTVTIPAGTAIDNVGHESAAVEVTYAVVYDFNGFFKPVDMGKMNVVNKAGSAVPLKFSLSGFQGMDVITSARFHITGTEESGDLVEEISTAGQSGLSYDADADQYVYVWKTNKTWAGKSGVLTVTLNDGTTHTVDFSFKK